MLYRIYTLISTLNRPLITTVSLLAIYQFLLVSYNEVRAEGNGNLLQTILAEANSDSRVVSIDKDDDKDGISNSQEAIGCTLKPDCDSDGVRDNEDIDDDGDGLIEIGTAEELDAVRYVLDGTGFKANEGAMLNQTGCGNKISIRRCSGYELVTNITLTDYISEKYPTEGWQPIAHDANSNKGFCQGVDFTGIFDGNGFRVRGLLIIRPDERCIGLFGKVKGGTIRRLEVVADRVIGGSIVGTLVGAAYENAKIIQSYVVSGSVSGDSGVGGLVGLSIKNTEIIQSYAVSGAVSGDRYIGGLVGWLFGAKIIQSYAVSGGASGDGGVGGLVGRSRNTEIIQSYAVSDAVSGDRYVGGLVGQITNNTKIIQSYTVRGTVRGYDRVGGLVGFGSTRFGIIQSYWDTQTSGRINDSVAGSGGYTSQVLRSPTGYNTIYGSWAGGVRVDGIDISGTIWCDEDLSGIIESHERRAAGHSVGNNQVWDFGTSTDYPALRCTPNSLANQRAWWSLDRTGKPRLNQDRLSAWLKGSLS